MMGPHIHFYLLIQMHLDPSTILVIPLPRHYNTKRENGRERRQGEGQVYLASPLEFIGNGFLEGESGKRGTYRVERQESEK